MAKQYGIKNESYWEHWGTLWEPNGNLGELDGNTFGTNFGKFLLPLPPTLEIEEKKIKPFQVFQNSSSPFST
jgi:hypothetical protein